VDARFAFGSHSVDARGLARGNGQVVATKLEFEQNYPAGPEAVMAMLKDPEFIRLKCDRTAAAY
jgi:hypothetical protein